MMRKNISPKIMKKCSCFVINSVIAFMCSVLRQASLGSFICRYQFSIRGSIKAHLNLKLRNTKVSFLQILLAKARSKGPESSCRERESTFWCEELQNTLPSEDLRKTLCLSVHPNYHTDRRENMSAC